MQSGRRVVSTASGSQGLSLRTRRVQIPQVIAGPLPIPQWPEVLPEVTRTRMCRYNPEATPQFLVGGQ